MNLQLGAPVMPSMAAWLRMRMTRELHAFRFNGLWISDLVYGARGSTTAPGIAVEHMYKGHSILTQGETW